MRLRFDCPRLFIGCIAIIVINVHVTLFVWRVLDQGGTDLSHPLNSELLKLSRRFDLRTDNNTRELMMQSAKTLEEALPTTLIESNTIIHSTIDPRKTVAEKVTKSNVDNASYITEKTLPSFAADESEFFISSMIERSASSSDLHLTTFMLCHSVLNPSTWMMNINKVHPATKDVWRRVVANSKATPYHLSGAREQLLDHRKFYCVIKESSNSKSYTVAGVFMPNRLTAEPAANRLLDILRCPLQDSWRAFNRFGSSNEELSVQILRGNNSIMTFTVPWRSRRTGYLVSNSYTGSLLDTWSNHYDYKTSSTITPLDLVHVCVPGSEKEPNRSELPLYLEFISHHLLIGAGHIHLPVPFPEISLQMNRLTSIFKTYIQEGKLSITSQSGDEIALVRSMGGLSLKPSTIRIMQINTCLYLAKGMAEYVLILELEDFFIPRGDNWNFKNILEAIQLQPENQRRKDNPSRSKSLSLSQKEKENENGSISTSKGNETVSQGRENNDLVYASDHAHPYCYINVPTEISSHSNQNSRKHLGNPWIGQRFAHVVESTNNDDPKGAGITRAMLPTHTIFQASTTSGGACRLPIEWTSCGSHGSHGKVLSDSAVKPDSFCGDGSKSPKRFLTGSTVSTVRRTHDFDEIVTEEDSLYLDVQTEASILRHVENGHNNVRPSELKNNVSLYTERYYIPVIKDLQKRGLEILMMVNDQIEREENVIEDEWSTLFSSDEMKKVFSKSLTSPVESSFSFYLPNNYSSRPFQEEVTLPNFVIDYSDYAIGAMIERVSDSFDLYATVFFLCHTILTPNYGRHKNENINEIENENENENINENENEIEKSATHMSAEVYDAWKIAMTHFESSTYTSDGVRTTPVPFYCNISHTANGTYYLAEGVFVPNNISTDSSANQKLDILRCKMQNTEHAYMNMARSNHDMRIEILRGDFSILKFRIPWGQRATGFPLDPPNEKNEKVSGFDSWVGFNKRYPGTWTPDKLHLCVSGWNILPSKTSISLLLEWIQHHILLGANHIFTGLAFHKDSEHFETIRKFTSSFINDKLVTLTSLSGDGIDQSYSFGGIVWSKKTIRTFHANTCLYLSKGSADYVGDWNFNEFFIPRGNNKNLLDVLVKLEFLDQEKLTGNNAIPPVDPSYGKELKLMRGMANNGFHLFCSLILHTETTFDTQRLYDSTDSRSIRSIWYGQRFMQGIKPKNKSRMPLVRSIYPTRTVFQGGLNAGGACRLPSIWNPCGENTDYCHIEKDLSKKKIEKNYTKISPTNKNYFVIDLLSEDDSKLIDTFNEGVLSKLERSGKTSRSSKDEKNDNNKPIVVGEYKLKYFPLVYEALEERGLAMALEIPEIAYMSDVRPQSKWMLFSDLQSNIKNAQQNAKHSSGQIWLDTSNLVSPLSGISLQSILTVSNLTSISIYDRRRNINHNNNNNNNSNNDNNDKNDKNDKNHNNDNNHYNDNHHDNDNNHNNRNNDINQFTAKSFEKNDFEYSTLPAFSHDKSELLLASMIERESDSFNLYLTTFFLSHQMILPDTSLRKIKKVRPDKDTLLSWSKAILSFPSILYARSGVRNTTPRYYCRIKASNTNKAYTVQGEFMPNQLSSDFNANSRTEVMRCIMNNSKEAYMTLARTNQEIIVEILREKIVLSKFKIPWSTRVQSRYLTRPDDPTTFTQVDSRPGPRSGSRDYPAGTSRTPRASKHDPWMGFNKNKPGVWEREKLYMCVPGMETPPSQKNMPAYLEFIQHHLLMGASHIFLTAPFTWGGDIMTSFLRILRPFIQDGTVSMNSHSDDDVDSLYSVRGADLSRDNVKIFQVNLCTYYSKGVADYVGIWDFDEFFIPKGSNKNLLDVISNAYPEKTLDPEIPRLFNENTSTDKIWPGGRGWADGNGHPACYLQLSSEVLANRPKPKATETETTHWVGDRFIKPTEPITSKNHEHFSFKKSIIPTKNVFQMGLHVHGGCHLEYPWNGCDKNHIGFCYKPSVQVNNSDNGSSRSGRSDNRSERSYNDSVEEKKFSMTHSFLDQVRNSDVKSVDSQSQGVLYHVMLFRDIIPSNITDPTATNDYTVMYFPATLSALKKKGYDALINTPKNIKTVNEIPCVADSWVEYDLVYNSRKTFGTLFPGFGKVSLTVPSSAINNSSRIDMRN